MRPIGPATDRNVEGRGGNLRPAEEITLPLLPLCSVWAAGAHFSCLSVVPGLVGDRKYWNMVIPKSGRLHIPGPQPFNFCRSRYLYFCYRPTKPASPHSTLPHDGDGPRSDGGPWGSGAEVGYSSDATAPDVRYRRHEGALNEAMQASSGVSNM